MKLVFDINVEGFRRWVSRRLRCLGIRTYRVPPGMAVCDDFIAEYADRLGAVVVTRDKKFPHKNKIVLTSTKYEKMWTELCRGLRDRAMSRAAGSKTGRAPDMPRRRR